ncbi:NADH-quinone oxidoreductase subunit C [Streptomyces sp. NPDC046751]|uniref:NADH-quinone oxidoreductase subunit C n=1 Tax=Streptomyces sp. NPDC046751 TaxID=3160977 RepID=UPI0034089E9D
MTTTPPVGDPGANPAGDAYDRLPDAAAELFGEGATAEYAYDLLTVDVPAAAWIAALETARDLLGCTYFDWLSAVDEPGTGFRVCAHVAALGGGRVRRLMIRTTIPHGAAVLPTAIDVYAGAAWHERETHEMFGIGFDGHPHLVPLLLPEGFEGHPLRKDFVLAARVAKAWPGAKEPGESEHGGPKRRTMLPPGVPDPNEWGPLKGQLPPAPSRPARTPRAAGDRPARRTRSASEGSAAQRTATATATPAPEAGAGTSPDTGTEMTPRATTPRRTRSASQGSASQQPTSGPAKTAEPGAGTGAGAGSGTDTGTGTGTEAGAAEPSSGTSDAPWHHARPAFEAATDATTGTDADPATRTDAAATPETPPKTPEASKSSEGSKPSETPESSETPETPESPETPKSAETPDHPAGGDTE